jgi:hypothetical protein
VSVVLWQVRDATGETMNDKLKLGLLGSLGLAVLYILYTLGDEYDGVVQRERRKRRK